MPENETQKTDNIFLCQLIDTLESLKAKESSYKRFMVSFRVIRKRVYKKVLWQFEKIGRRLGLTPIPPAKAEVEPQPLGLTEGELVRVKSRVDIRKTLNSEGRCQGMSYVPSVMDQYEGMILKVHTVVDRFYDEVRQRPLRLKNTVLLAGAHCDGSQVTDSPGCDRNCLIFWKDAWLERLPQYDSTIPVQAGTTSERVKEASVHIEKEKPSLQHETITPDDSLESAVRVRVKSINEIARTLDENGKTEDIKFIQEHMAEFCGKEFTVSKDVQEFYDEKRRTGFKLNNALVLDGVYCSGDQPWQDEICKRACLLFWHNRWLERID